MPTPRTRAIDTPRHFTVNRRAIIIVALLAILGGASGYFATHHMLGGHDAAVSDETKLDWLAREFALAPDAIAAIRRVQAEYAPLCAEHCAAIAVADRKVAAASPADRAAAEAELMRLREVCAKATRAHLESVAACMPAEQARRFLAMMEPRIAHVPGRAGAPVLNAAP